MSLIATAIENIDEALKSIRSARIWAEDYEGSVEAKCAEAIGHLESTKRFLEEFMKTEVQQ